MGSIQPSSDYTDRDLAALRIRFRSLIKSVFSNWTDFSTANFANILVDLFCFGGDINGYYLDANAAEAFIPTAVQRRSLIKLAKQLGYKPVGAGAATTVVTFTATGLSAPCSIAAGQVVKTLDDSNPILFQTLSPITLASPSSSVLVEVENSTSESESFTSTGQPNFSLTLGNSPYLDGSLTITTPQGTWTEVPSFVNSDASDKVFTVTVDDNDKAEVSFGDGVVAGLIPTGTIACSYKTGGGAAGNAAAHSIQSIDPPLFTLPTGQVTCDNEFAASGGVDRESADSIRQTAPQSITAPSVSVARTDFEVHARAVAGIQRALYLTANEDETIPVNTGYLYLLSPGANGVPGVPGPTIMDLVRRQFTDDEDHAPFPMMATQILGVFESFFLDVDVTAKVYLKKFATASNGLTAAATVRAAITAAVQQFFNPQIKNADGTVSDNPLIDFGYYLERQTITDVKQGVLAESDVANAVRDAEGVRELGPNPADFTLASVIHKWNSGTSSYDVIAGGQAAARQDLLVPLKAFPRLNSLTLINGDTGATL